MKITFILPGSSRSGGIKAPVQIANCLLRRGYDVRLVVNTKSENVKETLRKLWIKMRFPGNNNWLDLFNGQVEKYSDVTRCCFGEDEIVILSGWWAAREFHRLKRRPAVTLHYIDGVVESTELMKEAWGEDIPKIAVASYIEKIIKGLCGQNIMAVIPNGVDTSQYYPSVPDIQRDGVGTIFGSLPLKDPVTILKVLELLRANCPQIPQRVFGICRRPRQIPRRTYHRLPSIEMARQIYSRSLVWFVASRSEGFAIPVLEAMACGCAVVATDCGGPRDIIVNGENGFLAETANAKQIADKIKLLLDNPQLRRRFVIKSKDTVRAFSWDKSADKLEEVLHSVVSAKKEDENAVIAVA
jgi:glycosyltransferase involved in cell wall biosynthesis